MSDTMEMWTCIKLEKRDVTASKGKGEGGCDINNGDGGGEIISYKSTLFWYCVWNENSKVKNTYRNLWGRGQFTKHAWNLVIPVPQRPGCAPGRKSHCLCLSGVESSSERRPWLMAVISQQVRWEWSGAEAGDFSQCWECNCRLSGVGG